MHTLPLPRVLLDSRPSARALVHGGAMYPELRGEVLFYPFRSGSLVLARVSALPHDGFLGFHIHETGSCDCHETGPDAFHSAGGHYNLGLTDHPNHAGDLPPLLASGGHAFSLFYTGRFRPREVVNRSVIIHDMPDDFHTQPAGGAGSRLACGIIEGIHQI